MKFITKKHFPFIALLFCFITTSSFAQYGDKKFYLIDSVNLQELGPQDRTKLDSLLNVFHTTKLDSMKLKALYKCTGVQDFNTYVSYNKYLLNYIKPIVSGKKKIKASEKLIYKVYANSLYNTGFYFSEINQEDSAIAYFFKSLPYYKKINDKRNTADVYHAVGVSQFRLGQIEAALKNFHKSLKLFEKENYREGIGNCHSAIGNLYKGINEYDKALDAYFKALKIYEQENEVLNQATVWNFIGIAYKHKVDTLAAEKAYKTSLELSEKIEYDYGIATAKLNLGIIHQDRNELDQAISNYVVSLDIFKKIGSMNGASYSLNSLAVVMDKKGNYQKALEYAREAHELSLEIGYPESIVNSSSVLIGLLKKTGNYKEALEMKDLYEEMKDSIEGVETQKKALTQQLEFENDKKIMNLKRKQEEEKLIAQQEKEQQKIITISVIICLIIVILFSVFLYSRFRLIARQKGIIELQKHIVEEKNKEITDSITYAKRLQEAILPPLNLFEKHYPESFVLYQPKDIVAGDFYYLQELKDTVIIAVADCTGHGVPGAMVSVVCANAMNQAIREFGLTDPGAILTKVRELVIATFAQSGSEVKDGMDISLICIRQSLNTNSGKITARWAGANNPLWLIRNGELQEFNPDKQPVGIHAQPNPFTSHELQLEKNDLIYLFTDGFADQFGYEKLAGKTSSDAKGKKFKSANFKRLLVSVNEKNMKEQKSIVHHRFEEWKGDLEQIDDVCVIGIRV